jgi:hypothetical protein
MLLKKYKVCRGERWIRKYIKCDVHMCEVCKFKDENCVNSGRYVICGKVNFNGELFNGSKYRYGYVI